MLIQSGFFFVLLRLRVKLLLASARLLPSESTFSLKQRIFACWNRHYNENESLNDESPVSSEKGKQTVGLQGLLAN